MIPKDKAQELIERLRPHCKDEDHNWDQSIEAALVCVNEIVSQWEYIDTYISNLRGELNPNLKYWQEVKQEIIKL